MAPACSRLLPPSSRPRAVNGGGRTIMMHIMEDPREPDRLAQKVDAGSWVNRYIRPHLRPGAAVLDVGCGPGVLTAAVAGCCADVQATGLDSSATQLAAARRNRAARLRFIHGHADRLPFPDATFDFVY